MTTTEHTTTRTRVVRNGPPHQQYEPPRLRAPRPVRNADAIARDIRTRVLPLAATLGIAEPLAPVADRLSKADEWATARRTSLATGEQIVDDAVTDLLHGGEVDAVTAAIRKRRATLDSATLTGEALDRATTAARRDARAMLADLAEEYVREHVSTVAADAAEACATAIDRLSSDVRDADGAVAAGPDDAAAWAQAVTAWNRYRSAHNLIAELERCDALPERPDRISLPRVFLQAAQPWRLPDSIRNEPTAAHRLAAAHRLGAEPTAATATTAAAVAACWVQRQEADTLPDGVIDPVVIDLTK